MEWLLIVLISVLFASLNSLSVIQQWLNNPPGMLFTGIAHYYADYFLYISQLAQGAAGHVFFYSHRFTNEPLPATWIWWFNGLIGYLGHFFGLSVFTAYNLALMSLVFTLIMLYYLISRWLYPKNFISRLGFLLFLLTASSFFNLQKFLENRSVEYLGYFWFTPAPAFNRLGGVPHQVWQTILLILLSVNFSKVLNSNLNLRSRWFFYLSLPALALLSASANPIQMLIFMGAAFVTTLFIYLSRKHSELLTFLPLILTGLGAVSGAWATNQAFNTQLFQTVKVWEAAQAVNVSILDFCLALGPVVLFLPFGFVTLRKSSPLKIMFLTFSAISIVIFFSPLPALLTTSSARYLSPFMYVGLAVLGSDGLVLLINIATNIKSAGGKNIRLLSGTLLTVFLLIYVFFTTISLYDQLDGRTNPQKNPILISYLNHVPRSMTDALAFLNNEPFNPRPVVITEPDSDLNLELLIPALSDKITFTGHPLHTLYGAEKEALAAKFFSGAMNENEIRLFFNNHRIGYIIAKKGNTPEEKLRNFTFIEKDYDAGGIIIYKVNL